MASRPFAWEKTYPSSVRWDAPIRTTTLGAMLAKAVETFPTRIALEFRGFRIGFPELQAKANTIAAACLRAGIDKNQGVALYLPNCLYHPFFFFGAAKTGARLVHLSPLDAVPELAYKLKDSGARTLVTLNHASLLAAAEKLLEQGLLDRLIVCDDDAYGPAEAPLAALPNHPGAISYERFIADVGLPQTWPDIAPDDLALLQYTGGTTGQPKGAMLTHANLTAAIDMIDAYISPQLAPSNEPRKILVVLPLFHIMALTTILLRSVHNGNQVLLRMRFDAAKLVDDIERERVTSFSGVPTMWIAIAALPDIARRNLTSLLLCVSGGAPLPQDVARRVEKIVGCRLNSGWGMTETSPAGVHTPLQGDVPFGTIGLPMPGIALKIVSADDPSKELGANQTGELAIKGLNVTSGYWNKPEESKASFHDGFFLTGDIGHFDDNGFFFLVDRKKDLIISGGFNVYPQMIEQAIYTHPSVEEVLVIGVPDSYRGESAKAFVKLRAGAEPLTLEALNAFLDSKIGRHEMPRELEIRQFLPRTNVGKLSKKELRGEAFAAAKTSK